MPNATGTVWPNRLDLPPMSFVDESNTDGFLTVGLPRETIEWLMQMSHESGAAPEVLIASMLEAIRADDEVVEKFH